MHHQYPSKNFSLYFTHWDYLCGTMHGAYEPRARALSRAFRGSLSRHTTFLSSSGSRVRAWYPSVLTANLLAETFRVWVCSQMQLPRQIAMAWRASTS